MSYRVVVMVPAEDRPGEFEQDSGIKPLMPLYFHSQGHEIKELFSCLNIWLEEPKK